MKIKRITNPAEFNRLADDMKELFLEEDSNSGHAFLQHDIEVIKSSFSHTSILNWDLFVWAHEENNKFDSCIVFFNEKSSKFGVKLFSEFMWLSKNPKVGYALFSTAVKFARKNKFEYIVMSTVVSHPKHEKIKSFYQKMGFIKDSETYISKL